MALPPIHIQQVHERRVLRRDAGFSEDALKLLWQSPYAQQGNALHFTLRTHDDPYTLFYNFLYHDLRELPLQKGQSGEPVYMRPDAEQTIKELVEYMLTQQTMIQMGRAWEPDPIDITKIFNGNLEVFKNEIYSAMGTKGVCYSLDLTNMAKGIPGGFSLTRYFADGTSPDPRKLEVTLTSRMNLSFSSGRLEIDLADRAANVHHGKQI